MLVIKNAADAIYRAFALRQKRFAFCFLWVGEYAFRGGKMGWGEFEADVTTHT